MLDLEAAGAKSLQPFRPPSRKLLLWRAAHDRILADTIMLSAGMTVRVLQRE